MNSTPNYIVLSNTPGKALLIKDDGPWDRFPTITNEPERVIQALRKANLLPAERRLFYVDSDGYTDELIFDPKDGTFLRFRAGPLSTDEKPW